MTGLKGMQVTCVTLSSPDPRALARFYEQLLGWSITTDEPDWVELPNPQGGIGLAFHTEAEYQRPIWPSEPGQQIMQIHLEIKVDDLEAAVLHAKQCGAELAAFQPQDDVRVHLDRMGTRFVCISERTASLPGDPPDVAVGRVADSVAGVGAKQFAFESSIQAVECKWSTVSAILLIADGGSGIRFR